jgi:hypothetical protein
VAAPVLCNNMGGARGSAGGSSRAEECQCFFGVVINVKLAPCPGRGAFVPRAPGRAGGPARARKRGPRGPKHRDRSPRSRVRALRARSGVFIFCDFGGPTTKKIAILPLYGRGGGGLRPAIVFSHAKYRITTGPVVFLYFRDPHLAQ